MGKRDEMPARLSPRRQRLYEQGELDRRYRVADQERLEARVGRFLRRRAGRRWADVWPEVDAFLRKGREHPEIVARVRRGLLDVVACDRSFRHAGGANLHVVDGVLVAGEPRRNRGVTVAPTFSAADLMAQPELIER